MIGGTGSSGCCARIMGIMKHACMNAGGTPPRPPGRDYAYHSAGQKAAFYAGQTGFCSQATLKKTKNIPNVTSWTQNLDKSGDGLHRCTTLPRIIPILWPLTFLQAESAGHTGRQEWRICMWPLQVDKNPPKPSIFLPKRQRSPLPPPHVRGR